MKWLESFKIALIEEDVSTVDHLLKEIPEFKKIEEMRAAYALIGEAKKKFEKEQNNIAQKMNQMQQAKKFLDAHEGARESRLDEVY